MIKAIIVDDEPAAIKSLIWELNRFSDEITIIDSFTSATEAVSGINYLKPDCVFLDIEMPEMDGFTLLNKLDYRNFAIIITTAYNQYAIKAIKEQAIDYLLKPVDSDEIEKLLVKLKKLNSSHEFKEQFKESLKSLSKTATNSTIQIPVSGKILFIKVTNIVYCESDGNYTKVFLENSKDLYVTKKLKEIEKLLSDYSFFRVHNSYLINLEKVREFLKGEGYVVLENEKKIPVSRQKREAFLNSMSH